MPLRPAGQARDETRGLWLLLVPYLVGLVGLVIVPAAMTIGLSTFDYDLIRPPTFVGTDNFAALANDDVFRIAVRNSLVFVAVAVPLRLVVAVALALLLHPPSLRAGASYRLTVFLPIVVPEVAFAIAWLWILNPVYGPLNGLLSAIGIAPVPWLTDPAAAQAAIVMISLFTIGEAFVVTVAARRSISRDLYDVAVTEGASDVALLRFVTFPAIAPVLLLLALRDVVLLVHATFVPSLLVTGGGPPPYATTYAPTFIYELAFEYLRYGYAAGATAAFLLVTAAVVVLQVRILRSWTRSLSS